MYIYLDMWRISPHGMIRRQAACLRDSRQSSGRLKSLEAVGGTVLVGNQIGEPYSPLGQSSTRLFCHGKSPFLIGLINR